MDEKKSGTFQAEMLFVSKDEDEICQCEKFVQKNVSSNLHQIFISFWDIAKNNLCISVFWDNLFFEYLTLLIVPPISSVAIFM
jgi:hypothetical protein